MNNECPKCGFAVGGAAECPRCGIIVAKYQARQAGEASEGGGGEVPGGRPAEGSGSSVIPEGRSLPTKSGLETPPSATTASPLQRGRGESALPAPPRGPKVRLTDRQHFFQAMGEMLEAGVPFIEALDILSGSARRPGLVLMIHTLRGRLDAGASLAEAFAGLEDDLGEEAVVLAGPAERTGHLPELFKELAEGVAERRSLRSSLLSSLLYPALMILIAVVLLPVPVIFADGLAAYLKAVGMPLLFGLGALGLWKGSAWAGRSVPGLARLASSLRRDLPAIGSVVRRGQAATFAATLGRYLGAGLSPLEGLEAAASACGDPAVQRGAKAACDRIRGGGTLAEGLQDARVLPEDAMLRIAAAERAGKLPGTLAKAAQAMRKENQSAIKTRVVILSVFVMVSTASWVGHRVVMAYLAIAGKLGDLFKGLSGGGV